MSDTKLEPVEGEDLDAVIGGLSVPGAPQGQQQPQDDRPWVEGLTDTLKRRGFDPNIDPQMERRPPNPDMDPGILRPLPGGPRSGHDI
jgi:hypothetical protein